MPAQRIDGLDLLRAMAVLLVLGRHANLPDSSPIILKLWQQGGWVGVDLFFVLSGFLIASLLVKEQLEFGHVRVKRFLLRRAFKIYPSFFLLLFITLLVQILFTRPPSALSVIGEALFLQNYVGSIWPHTWSLAVEEHFYLGIAAMFVLFRPSGEQRIPTWIIPAFLIVAVVCLILRITASYIFPVFSYRMNFFATHLRVDSLFCGVTLAYLWHCTRFARLAQKIPTIVLVLSAIACLAPCFLFPLTATPWIYVWWLAINYIGSAILVIAVMNYTRAKGMLTKGLCSVGRASYSIYLWHMAVAIWLMPLLEIQSNAFAYLTVYLAVSIGIGLALHSLLEVPVLRFREIACSTFEIK